jgi:hypothetical protein
MSIYEIPSSRRRGCVFCSAIVDSNAQGVYELVEGWAMNRKQGTNAIALKKSKNLYACSFCIDKLRQGIPIGQMTLFQWEADK